MKLVITLVVLSVFCTILSNAFLFGHKFKDGCDPDPCKHKSKCVLDPKNKNLSHCKYIKILKIFNQPLDNNNNICFIYLGECVNDYAGVSARDLKNQYLKN